MEATTLVLKTSIDEGLPGPEHFEMKKSVVPAKLEKEGSVMIQALAMSADPYLRIRFKSFSKGNGFAQSLPGEPVNCFMSAQVIQSTHADWKVGDLMGGALTGSTIQILDLSTPVHFIWKLPTLNANNASLGLGALGMPGATAYGGLVDILACKEGETIWVSAAGGAVGSMVGQIAKNVFGCKVIGSAGGPEKCKMVVEKFGFDACVDYRLAEGDAGKMEAIIREAAPEGIDMYYENVGGFHFDAALKLLRPRGRIAICGGISGYNAAEVEPNRLLPMSMVYTQQRIEGFVCNDWLGGARGTFHKTMPKWLEEGKVIAEETRFEGIESWPLAFRSLFEGKNNGKVVVDIKPIVDIKCSI